MKFSALKTLLSILTISARSTAMAHHPTALPESKRRRAENITETPTTSLDEQKKFNDHIQALIAENNSLKAKIANLPISGESIYESVAPTLCKIVTKCDQDNESKGYIGSCVSISPYFILTAHHVLDDFLDKSFCDPSALELTIEQYRTAPPHRLTNGFNIVYVDPANDIAIIRMNSKSPTHLDIEYSTKPGESGYTLGYSRGDLFIAPAMIGAITSNEIRFTGHSFPGDSGGSLVNSKGKLIGIVTEIMYPSKFNHPPELKTNNERVFVRATNLNQISFRRA